MKKPKKDKGSKKSVKGFRALAQIHRRETQDEFELPVVQDDDAPAPLNAKPVKPPPNALDEIVSAAFDASTTTEIRRRLRHNQGLAAVVIVPDKSWASAAARHVRAAFGERWHLYVDDPKGSRSIGSSADAAHDLSRGLCVMAVGTDIKRLPACVVSAPDVTIVIGHPGADVLRRAITRFCGRSPGELPATIAAGLDLSEIVAAFRPGSGPAEIVRRLTAAGRSSATTTGRVPALETATEYGEAQRWGLSLAKDIEDFRAGRIKWDEVDRGICLHSAPGMGKTLFARVLANACGVPLVSTSIAAWFAAGPGYLDSVIKAMRAAFAEAQTLANPCCILFIDELDALPNRETMSPRGRDWWTPVITDALLLLDSTVSARTGIVVVGSTNRIHDVDPALLRPGRLEKIVDIEKPDAEGAMNILKFHLADQKVDGDATHLGALLEGHTGAEIMHVVRTARRAARQAGRTLAVADLEAVLLPPVDAAPAKLFRMAVHEAAHAVAALATDSGTIDRVTLRFEGNNGGRTVVNGADDDLVTARDIEDRVIVGLAARAAERLLCGCASTGSGGSTGSDLASATAMIAALHASFGLGEDVAYLSASHDAMREMALNQSLRERVERHLRELQERAAKVVEANRDAIVAVADALAAKRHLDGRQVDAIVKGKLVHFVRKETAA